MSQATEDFDVSIIGGGAAGIFTAIQIAETTTLRVQVFEATGKLLSKVKISGGGRCNVTHQYSPEKQFSQNYPRGQKEIRSSLSHFDSQKMRTWLLNHGVETKVELDGRVFPNSNSSQTIIDCFLQACKKLGVAIRMNQNIDHIEKLENEFQFFSKNEALGKSRYLVFATGSRPQSFKLAELFGHEPPELVPSLFSFNITKDKRLDGLSGLSFPFVRMELQTGTENFRSEGPLLITHWGLSGPAILRISAFAAVTLAKVNYAAKLRADFLPKISDHEIEMELKDNREKRPQSKLKSFRMHEIPKNYWERILDFLGILDLSFYELSNARLESLKTELKRAEFPIAGKTTYKEEFVTAGGIHRSEIDFKTMESKKFPNLYFAGEVIDIDGVTGGFNFQNCWSGAALIAEALSKKQKEEASQGPS